MTTAYTSLLGLALPVTGELSGTWGDTVNNSITSLLDTSVAGTTNVSTDGDVTLTTTTGAANTARQAILLFSGARTALRTVTAPAQSKVYTVINATTGGFSVKLVGAGPTTGLTIPNGASAVVAWNGSDFVEIGAGSIGNLIVNGTLTVTGATTLQSTLAVTGNITNTAGTANGVAYLNGSKVVTSGSALTYNGTTLGVSYSDTAFAGGFSIRNTATTGAAWARMDLQSGSNSAFAIYQQTDGTATINATGANSITFSQNGSEGMRLTSTGLGIGTSSPAARLGVYAGAMTNQIVVGLNTTDTLYGSISFNGDNSSGRLGLTGGGGSDKNLYVDVPSGGAHHFRNAASVKMLLDSSGNLGLGVTPSAWGSTDRAFQVGNTVSLFRDGAANAYFAYNNYLNSSSQFIYSNNGFASSYFQGGGQHQWFIAPSGTAGNAITFTQAMTLDASGNLGLGTTSPTSRGHFVAADNGSDDNTITLGFAFNSTSVQLGSIGTHNTSSTDGGLKFSTLSSGTLAERARIDSSGNLLIGSTTNTTNSNLILTGATRWAVGTQSGGNIFYIVRDSDGVGQYMVQGSTSWTATSDERLKDIIEPISNASSKVSTLRAVIGKFKKDAEGTRRSFLIAQDVQAVLPEAVTVQEDEFGTLGIQYTEVIPLLVAAIKEQNTVIESLKARLDAANL